MDGSSPSRVAWLALVVALGGCFETSPAADYPDPTVGDGIGQPGALVVAEPAAYARVEAPNVVLRGAVHLPGAGAVVELAHEGGAWERASVDGESWEVATSLLHGANVLSLRARDADGYELRGTHVLSYAGGAPGLVVLQPADGTSAGGTRVALSGRVSAGSGRTVVEVNVQVGDRSATSTTPDETGSWTATAKLEAGVHNRVTVTATDSAGAQTDVVRTVVHDDADPVLHVDHPAEGAVVRDALLEVSGRASDDAGVAVVEIAVGSAPLVPAVGTEAWHAAVALLPGDNTITVRATDRSGRWTEVQRHVRRARTVTLRHREPTPEELAVEIAVDRSMLDELTSPAEQRDIVLYHLDLAVLLTEAVRAIRDPVAYGLDPTTWGPAAQNMRRMLAMTPANFSLDGTSLEAMAELSAGVGVSVGGIVSDLLQLGPEDPFFATEDVVRALLETMVRSHPHIDAHPQTGAPTVAVSLYDALHDLAPLAERLGPVGPHPGVVRGALNGRILLPHFAMQLRARSNLHARDGVDLSLGKDYLFVLRDTEGPSFQDLVELDFLDPDDFQVVGLADDPSLRFAIRVDEHDGFVAAGTEREAGPDGEFFRGSGAAWQVQTWLFERFVVELAYVRYRALFAEDGYSTTISYDWGERADSTTLAWDRGWLAIETPAGLGDPPPPLYIWDLLTEVAQRRLHEGGLAEGEAAIELELTDVHLPLDAETILAEVRPLLASQQDALSRYMVGDHGQYESACDLYLERGADGRLYLFFVVPEDVPGRPETYARPGLYAAPDLRERRSTPEDGGSGDARHEKVVLSAAGGEVYYAQDVDGRCVELRLGPATDSAVTVELMEVACAVP